MHRAVQQSQESLNRLAERYNINPKTVAKWKKRSFVHETPRGPKAPRSTVLTPEQEAVCVALRKHTRLPLDDGLYTLQSRLPDLTRASRHRLFQRHGISRRPEMEGEKPARKKFNKFPFGDFPIDIAEVRTEEGKRSLFVAIDRTSKFAYAELVSPLIRQNGIGAVPTTAVSSPTARRTDRRLCIALTVSAMKIPLNSV